MSPSQPLSFYRSLSLSLSGSLRFSLSRSVLLDRLFGSERREVSLSHLSAGWRSLMTSLSVLLLSLSVLYPSSLAQTFLVWQLLLSAIFLRGRYRLNQILGCFLVTVVITVASGSGANASLKGAGIFWPLLMISSFLLQAADTVLKVTTHSQAVPLLTICLRLLEATHSKGPISGFLSIVRTLISAFIASYELFGIILGSRVRTSFMIELTSAAA